MAPSKPKTIKHAAFRTPVRIDGRLMNYIDVGERKTAQFVMTYAAQMLTITDKKGDVKTLIPISNISCMRLTESV